MEAIFLDCGAGAPQLKRNPLGSFPSGVGAPTMATSGEPIGPWKVIFDYLAGRELFEPAAARLAAAIEQVGKEMRTPPPGIPDVPDEDGVHGHLVWLPLDEVPEADRPRAAALLQRAYELLENGEAA